jgi:hypothetical protein
MRRLGRRVLLPVLDLPVPSTRGECVNGPRPCPHVRCSQHLWLRQSQDMPGRRSSNRRLPPEQLWARGESCVLDVADRVEQDELSRDAIGDLLGVSRERVRQIEVQALDQLRPRLAHEAGRCGPNCPICGS